MNIRGFSLGWLAAALLLGPDSSLAAPGPPTGLAVEDREAPIGVGDPTPEFSWIPQDSAPNAVQTAYQLLVASTADKLAENIGDLWDSGRVESSAVAYVTYRGEPLTTRGIYYWKVRTWNGAGEVGPYAAPVRFEMGLLSNADWGVNWIWRDSDEIDDYTYFRRSFRLEAKAIARARVYVSATHRHEFSINGQPVAKGPNFAYPDHQYYQTFAVEPFLESGEENVFGLLCHWYGPGQGRPESSRGMIFKAVIDYEDGASTSIASDSAWKVHRGEWVKLEDPLRNKSNRVPAETIDARDHPRGWSTAGFDDNAWQPAVELGTHPTPPWTGNLLAQETAVTEYEIAPVRVRRLGEGRWVADFGKVYAAIPKVTIRGAQPGQEILITTGYRVREDGTAIGFAQKTDLTYRYIARGGEETVRPYWYLGFRYIQVDNSPSPHDARSIRMIVRHHTVDWRRSSFETSDATLNGIWELCKRSTMLGSQEQFIDTPTREQAQFTYDAYLTATAAAKLFGERDLGQQALREFAQSQPRFFASTGEVNSAYPNGDGRQPIPDLSQIFIIWLWEYYQETGDREMLEDLFGTALRVAQWVKTTENPASGLVDLGSDSIYAYKSGVVDWPDSYEYDMKTTQRTVMSLNAYLDYLYVARMARELGRDEVAQEYDRHAKAILSAVQQRLWDEEKHAYVDGLYADGSKSSRTSQQPNMMMLSLGLAQGERQRGAMAAVKRAWHATSPLLVWLLMRAYGEHDEDAALLEFLTNPEGRNWAYTLADGGTFTYEGWEGRRRPRERSESHPFAALGGVIALQEYVLGVKRAAPQFARLVVRPHTLGLRFARGTIPTQRGPVEVDWRVEEKTGDFRMKVRLPVNVTTSVYVPRGEKPGLAVMLNGESREAKAAGRYLLLEEIGSGEYEFVR